MQKRFCLKASERGVVRERRFLSEGIWNNGATSILFYIIILNYCCIPTVIAETEELLMNGENNEKSVMIRYLRRAGWSVFVLFSVLFNTFSLVFFLGCHGLLSYLCIGFSLVSIIVSIIFR